MSCDLISFSKGRLERKQEKSNSGDDITEDSIHKAKHAKTPGEG
jgi:hypothetical protein